MRKRMIAKTLYLSSEENKMLNKKCRELKKSYSEYIRKLINDYKPKKFDINTLNNYIDKINIINNGIIDLTNQFYKYGYVDEYKLKYYFSKTNEIINDNFW